MFTGIIKGVFNIHRVVGKQDFMTIELKLDEGLCEGLEVGASVAVNGVCLTVTSVDDEGSVASFDVMQETLRATNLSGLQEGDQVNIERAARFGDEIGGHLLSGHVHDTVTVQDIIKSENNTTLVFSFDAGWQDYIQPKGYIALNGASLTVGETVDKGVFCVHLIPETLRQTTFGSIRKGNLVNLEIDSQTQAIVNTVKAYIKGQTFN
ncbi:riboflavin synthase [Endozoicomonas numazuensis]|uniref:Riboflavin synthase n=1 Tax=Endozoicomonas numazuensis TaxID=1137799 RepID=A0A081N124_9GAMM|nr:riboflavin synthase [Endozoicomonas numazuensis]KEQ12147.1 riboflavin synthase subunit alpha [Endozoicomonas numazuensis]